MPALLNVTGGPINSQIAQTFCATHVGVQYHWDDAKDNKH